MKNFQNFPFRAAWVLISAWWRSEEKLIAWLGLIAIIFLGSVYVFLDVQFANFSRDLYNTIEQRALSDFIDQILVFAWLLFFKVMTFSGRNYLDAWYSFHWRQWMTSRIQNKWLSGRHFYKISRHTEGTETSQRTDNPDQRISSDVSHIAFITISLFSVLFKDTLNLCTFSVILWSLSSNINLKIPYLDCNIPGFLVWIAMLYSLIGIFFVFKIGKPLIGLDRQNERCEADFRYKLMRIFEHREEIATLSGESEENDRLTLAFTALKINYNRILRRGFYINVIQNFHLNVQQFVPLFIVGPLYFAHKMTLGVMMQITSIFASVSHSMSAIAMQFTNIASWTAALQRVLEFEASMKASDFVTHQHNESVEPEIIANNITILNSKHGVLWRVLPIRILKGQHKMLMAPSGRGKTSLLRIMAGLSENYDKQNAELLIPKGTFFVPQRTYMPIGTLRQCLSYPSHPFGDDKLLPLMHQCLLDGLIPMLDKTQDYHQILSLGEQQRINFVRVLLQDPQWLVMDEPTSHLNEDYAEKLYSLLLKSLPDTGMLIISHRKSTFFDDIITPC